MTGKLLLKSLLDPSHLLSEVSPTRQEFYQSSHAHTFFHPPYRQHDLKSSIGLCPYSDSCSCNDRLNRIFLFRILMDSLLGLENL